MKLLQSDKVQLPVVYLITDRSRIKDIPIGVPFIYSTIDNEKYLIRILEYEVLLKNARASGYPFDFTKILEDNGYDDLIEWWYSHPYLLEYITEETTDSSFEKDSSCLETISYTISDFIKDKSCVVDIEKLKELNVFPTWLDVLNKAIETNIQNYAIFNNNMYNKKLEGMYGAIELSTPLKNLIIIDISGSIPKGVSATTLSLAQNLAESFYADLLITGSKSTLYDYSVIHTLDIENMYKENGIDNDQTYFKNLLTGEEKEYKTAIVFGDNHSPSSNWRNTYNINTKVISKTDGQKLCKWKIEKVISFHTSSDKNLAGYADWFSPIEVENISGWVKYLN